MSKRILNFNIVLDNFTAKTKSETIVRGCSTRNFSASSKMNIASKTSFSYDHSQRNAFKLFVDFSKNNFSNDAFNVNDSIRN